MSVIITEFRDEDLALMVPDASHRASWLERGGEDGVKVYALCGPAWSIFDVEEARLLFIGGIVRVHAGYGTCWSVFAAGVGHAMVAITRRAKAEIAAFDARRIDMFCSAAEAAHVRWAAMLGFHHEATLRQMMGDGADAQVWVKLKEMASG